MLIDDIQGELTGRPYELAHAADGWMFRIRTQFADAIKAAADLGEQTLAFTEMEMGVLCAIAYPDAEWSLKCRACDGKAFLAGMQVGEEVIDTQPDEYAMWETVEKELYAEQFRCPVCDLALKGTEEQETVGIDVYHTLIDEREMEFEPDYGND